MVTRIDHKFALTRWTWINFTAGIIVGAWLWHPFWSLVGDLARLLSLQVGG